MFIRKTLSFYTCANIFNLLAITNDFDYISMVDSLNVVNFMRKRSTQVRLHFFLGIFLLLFLLLPSSLSLFYSSTYSQRGKRKKKKEEKNQSNSLAMK